MGNIVVFIIFIATNFCCMDASQINFRAEPATINSLTTKEWSLRCSVQDAIRSQTMTRSLMFPRMVNYSTPSTTTETTHTPTGLHTMSTRPTTTPTPSTTPGEATSWTTSSHTTSTTTGPTQGSTTISSSLPSPSPNAADVSHVTSIVISKLSNLTGQPQTIADVTPFQSAAVDQAFLGLVTAQGDSMWSPVSGEKAYLQVTWPDPKEDQAGEYLCEVAALNAHNHPVNLRSTLSVTSRDPTLADVIDYVIQLERRLEDALTPRVQKGTEECHLNTFAGSQTVRFGAPFRSTPTVWTTFSDVRYSSSADGEFKVALVGANSSHFTYDCLAAHTSFTFDWLAIDN
ncbi:hypothetical protein Btru_057392 [Bulinus truncatus]|nr:hypothetical protein Btru_057392 [Bulinus truncatus]